MTNFEFYKDEILKVCEDGQFAMVNGQFTVCKKTNCLDCMFAGGCAKNMFNWLYAEHIEKPTLNKYERALCEALQTGWIARDENNAIHLFIAKPHRDNLKWEDGERHNLPFNIMELYRYNPAIRFNFIKWEDEKPWSVEEMMELEVRE